MKATSYISNLIYIYIYIYIYIFDLIDWLFHWLFRRLAWYLTHFMLLFFWYTPWKHQKTKGFLIFSGCIESPVGWNGLMTFQKVFVPSIMKYFLINSAQWVSRFTSLNGSNLTFLVELFKNLIGYQKVLF